MKIIIQKTISDQISNDLIGIKSKIHKDNPIFFWDMGQHRDKSSTNVIINNLIVHTSKTKMVIYTKLFSYWFNELNVFSRQKFPLF